MAINYFMRLNTYAAGTVIVPKGSSGKSSYIQIQFNTSHLSIFIILLQYKEIKGHTHEYAGLTFEGDTGKEVAFWRLT